ncbi:MAG: carboxypeptidase regulatory-like domain-containing protein [Bryobacteraceae bacterium]
MLTAAALLAGCGGASEKKTDEAAVEYFQVDPATAGSIAGKVTFTGKKPVLKKIRMEDEEDCLKARSGNEPMDPSVTVNEDGTLRNVLVYVKSGLEGKKFAPVEMPLTFDQRGCMFAPRVLGIQVNQPLKVTNSDPVTHNVHPMPRVNREWNQGQPSGADPVERQFSQVEGPFPVKCNVHAWMRAYFVVLDHPYYAVTGDSGTFELKNLPPGEYTLEAWQERYPAQIQKVTVAAGGASTADFTFQGE